MGAWGVQSFANDDALDWSYELMEAEDDGPVIEALAEVVDAAADDYIEVDSCGRALAAAEVVAALGGQGASDLPEDLVEWMEGQSQEVVDELVAKHVHPCIQAVARIRDDSEAAELWAESDDHSRWLATLNDLIGRLRLCVVW